MRTLALVFCIVGVGAAPALLQASDICHPKKYCTQIKTCAEAYYRYTACADLALDRDGDGVPCETMCGKTISSMNARKEAEPFDPGGSDTAISSTATPDPNKSANAMPVQTLVSSSCEGKRTCGQMLSCQEATFYLQQCGVGSLDGDGDGVPCDGLCK